MIHKQVCSLAPCALVFSFLFHCIAYGADGHVFSVGNYISGDAHTAVVDFNRDGTLSNAFDAQVGTGTTGSFAAFSIATLGGDLLIATSDRIGRYATDGTFKGLFADRPAAYADGSGLARIETDATGNVYASWQSRNQCCSVYGSRFDSNGNLTGLFTTSNSSFTASSERSIDADAAGNVYFATDNPDSILKFSPNGAFIGSVTASNSKDMAIDEANNVMYVPFNSGAGKGIYVYDLNTQLPTFLRTIDLPNSLTSIEGISFEPETGHLFAVDLFKRLGVELTVNGTVVQTYDDEGANTFNWDIVSIRSTSVPEPSLFYLSISLALYWSAQRRRTCVRRVPLASPVLRTNHQ